MPLWLLESCQFSGRDNSNIGSAISKRQPLKTDNSHKVGTLTGTMNRYLCLTSLPFYTSQPTFCHPSDNPFRISSDVEVNVVMYQHTFVITYGDATELHLKWLSVLLCMLCLWTCKGEWAMCVWTVVLTMEYLVFTNIVDCASSYLLVLSGTFSAAKGLPPIEIHVSIWKVHYLMSNFCDLQYLYKLWNNLDSSSFEKIYLHPAFQGKLLPQRTLQ